jgi:hypothetical protein
VWVVVGGNRRDDPASGCGHQEAHDDSKL